jgi:hypothetical protein
MSEDKKSPLGILLNFGYIDVLDRNDHTYKYFLTKTGKEQVEQILEELKKTNINDYNKLLDQVKI